MLFPLLVITLVRFSLFAFLAKAIEESSFLSIESCWPGDIEDGHVVLLHPTSSDR